jgi:ribosomal protein L36
MKVRSAIKKMCTDCYIVKRGNTRFVYCKKHGKHKQRQGFCTLITHDSIAAMEITNTLSTMRQNTLNYIPLNLAGLSRSTAVSLEHMKPQFTFHNFVLRSISMFRNVIRNIKI